jgi:hypothetical protein
MGHNRKSGWAKAGDDKRQRVLFLQANLVTGKSGRTTEEKSVEAADCDVV